MRKIYPKLVSWTAADSIAALKKFYCKPEWAFVAQVRDATGWDGSRYADAVAMNVWPSRGMEIHGFEIKTYRGDWLNELRNPEKSTAIQKYCDYWWLVIPAEADGHAVAKIEEVPVTWGLITVQGEGVTFSKKAPKLSPEELDRGFVASILRNAAEDGDALQKEFERGVKYGTEHADHGSFLENALEIKREHRRLTGLITRLETSIANISWASESMKLKLQSNSCKDDISTFRGDK